MAQTKKELKAEVQKLQEELRKLRNVESYEDKKQPLNTETSKRGVSNNIKGSIRVRRQLRGHYGKIYALQWAEKKNNYMVSASQDGKLIIWNAFTNAKLHAIPLRSSWVMTCAFTPSGNYVASGGLDNLISVFKIPGLDDPESLETKTSCELAKHEGYLSCCRFIDDKTLFSSSGDSTCIMWDMEKQLPQHTFTGHKQDVMSLCVDTQSHTFVTGSCDKTSILWDYRTQKSVMTFPGHTADVNSVDFFPGCKAFASGSDDSTLRLFDIRACAQLQIYGQGDLSEGTSVTSVAFSKSGGSLFSGSDENICHVWDTASSKLADELKDHENRVTCLGLSPAGDALCTGSWDTYIRVYA